MSGEEKLDLVSLWQALGEQTVSSWQAVRKCLKRKLVASLLDLQFMSVVLDQTYNYAVLKGILEDQVPVKLVPTSVPE